jgi:Zn-dependent alcohol dehydrogenase
MRVESHSIAKEKTLKAAVCRTFGLPLIVEDITIADPGEGEVKVKLAACAICHSDIMLADGHWGGELPAIYGHEASGIVESLGPGVHDLAVGDRVVVTLIRSCGHCHYCAHAIETQCEATFPLDEHSPLSDHEGAVVAQGLNAGAFAESVVVEQSQICRIPDDIPLEVASILGCGVLTGFGAVTNTVEVSPGSIVAVMGCGGVGINSIQAAAYRGASRVIAVDVLDEKLEQALRFGATHTVNSSLPTFVDDVLGLSGGRGADYVFVTVGAKSAIKQSGTTVIVGMPASEVLAEYDPGDLASKGQSIVGSKMGSSSVSRDIPKLVALYQQGDLKLDELVSQRFSLENINEAIASVKRGEALRNLVVF